MKRVSVFVLMSVGFLVGCGDEPSDELGFGDIEDSVYRNSFFGLSIEIPPGWSVQDQEVLKQAMDIGSDILAGDDNTLKATLKASELSTVTLLGVTKHPLGAPVLFNANFQCMAERISHMPGITRGSDYHFHTKKMFQASQTQVSFTSEIYSIQIDAVPFDVLPVEMSMSGQVIKQKLYTTVLNGYALSFVATYTTNEDEAELDKVIMTARFHQ